MDAAGDADRHPDRQPQPLRGGERVVGLGLRRELDVGVGGDGGRGDDDRGAVGPGRKRLAMTGAGGGEREAASREPHRDRAGHSLLRGWMLAMSSASATTAPSTFASPRSFQIAPPLRSGTTSSVSTSPGTTGLRNFALSMAMK